MANKSNGGHVHLRNGVKPSDGRQYNMSGSADDTESYAMTDDEANAIRGVTNPHQIARILRKMRNG